MSRRKQKIPYSHRDAVDWFRKDDGRALRLFLHICVIAIVVIFVAQLAYDLGLAG